MCTRAFQKDTRLLYAFHTHLTKTHVRSGAAAHSIARQPVCSAAVSHTQSSRQRKSRTRIARRPSGNNDAAPPPAPPSPLPNSVCVHCTCKHVSNFDLEERSKAHEYQRGALFITLINYGYVRSAEPAT